MCVFTVCVHASLTVRVCSASASACTRSVFRTHACSSLTILAAPGNGRSDRRTQCIDPVLQPCHEPQRLDLHEAAMSCRKARRANQSAANRRTTARFSLRRHCQKGTRTERGWQNVTRSCGHESQHSKTFSASTRLSSHASTCLFMVRAHTTSARAAAAARLRAHASCVKKQIVADESVALNSLICAALSAAIPKTRPSDPNALPVLRHSGQTAHELS
jgi:hypothetical protein